MTDNEIVKALECCMDEMGCKKGCPCFDPKSKSSHCSAVGDNGLEKLALDLINRLQEKDETRHKVFETKCEELEIAKAENERLQTEIKLLTENGVTAKCPHCAFLDTGIFLSKESNGYEKWNAYVRNQAYKEFAELVQGEIDDALHSNYNAKEERHAKCQKQGIHIDPEDSFLMYCDGKIHALSGLNSYIDNLLKEMEGGASEVED